MPLLHTMNPRVQPRYRIIPWEGELFTTKTTEEASIYNWNKAEEKHYMVIVVVTGNEVRLYIVAIPVAGAR